MMKTIKSFLTMVLAVSATFVSAQIDTPQPSSPGSVYSKVGLTDVTIEYSRPKMKGRTIFGGEGALVPYGQIWRTGANSGSKLTINTDANIGGTDVKAGSYLIFTVPGQDSWDVMLYSDVKIGGNVSAYNKENEVMRTQVKPMKLSNMVETFAFQITDISEDNTSANIEMSWGDVAIKIPVKVNFHDQVMQDIAAKTQVNPGNYVAAANYYLTTGENLEQALEWMNMYLAVPGNDKQFWHVHTKAKIQAALGMNKEAIETATDSMNKAKANASGDFGYVQNNQSLIDSIKKKK